MVLLNTSCICMRLYYVCSYFPLIISINFSSDIFSSCMIQSYPIASYVFYMYNIDTIILVPFNCCGYVCTYNAVNIMINSQTYGSMFYLCKSKSNLKGQCVTFVFIMKPCKFFTVHVIFWAKKIMRCIMTNKHVIKMLPGRPCQQRIKSCEIIKSAAQVVSTFFMSILSIYKSLLLSAVNQRPAKTADLWNNNIWYGCSLLFSCPYKKQSGNVSLLLFINTITHGY